MKKIVKICLFVGLFIVIALVIFLGTYFLVNYLKYQNIPLNTDALTSPALNIEIFDNNSEKIEDENSFNGNYVTINKIPEKTKEAFISIEDKDFYKHNGLNKKRILKAVYNNLKSMSLKEGASTISQQLIKNTHLSNEKTFTAFEVVEVCVRNCTTAILIWHGEYIVHSNMLSFYIVINNSKIRCWCYHKIYMLSFNYLSACRIRVDGTNKSDSLLHKCKTKQMITKIVSD